MKLLLWPFALGILFLFVSASPQPDNSNGNIVVYTRCKSFQDPLDVIRNNKQFFIDRMIHVSADTAVDKCGYLLTNSDGKQMHLGFMEDGNFIETCDKFFFEHPPKKPKMQFKLLK